MAIAGIFVLITNEGKQDKMLMASELLKNRLDAISLARASNPAISDPTPTLLDIEKTHILFTNAHFKPFAAIGFEYNKTSPTGAPSLGGEITYSIPQFGDFFHDMVVYVKMKQPTLTATASDDSDKPLMRWCPYPGERLFESVEFEVNGNPLDKYTPDAVNFHREFSVQPHKKAGWDRCVGQEQSEDGFVDQPNWANSGVAPSSIGHRFAAKTFSGDQTPTGQKDVSVYKEMLVPLLLWFNKDVRLSVPSVAIPYGQRFIKVKLADGDKLVNLVPRGAGTWDDAGIGGYLNYDGMIRTMDLYINNIFVNPEVHNIFIKRIGFTLIRVHRIQESVIDKPSDEILLQQLKWPIENLQIRITPREYRYKTDSALNRRQNLDKWHLCSKAVDTTRTTQGWRSGKVTVKNSAFSLPQSILNVVTGAATAQLRLTKDAAWAIGANVFEGLTAGDIVTLPLTTTNTGDVTVGTTQAVSANVTLTLEVAEVVPDADVSTKGYVVFKQLVGDVSGLTGLAGLTTNNVGLLTVTASVSRVDSAELSATVTKTVSTIDSISIKAHGIPIYNDFVKMFYSSYFPYHYGGPNLRVPEVDGAAFIPFGLYPGTYQPNGHINVSRAREFYISYTSSVASTNSPCELVVLAEAINFLLISDGSAVLRYST